MATAAEIQAVFDLSSLSSLRIVRWFRAGALNEFYVVVNGPTSFSNGNNLQGRSRWVTVAAASDDITSASAIFNSMLVPA